MLTPGATVTVRLIKQPRAEVRYPAEVRSDDGTHIVVRAPWAGPPERDLGFVCFRDGDVFTEHYWRDRWYSVKQIHAPDGTFKGWYCDVCRPVTVRKRVLIAVDLDLDLWVSADRAVILRLDEDEFLASGLTEREPQTARRARQALDELARLAEDGFAGLD